MKYFLPRLLKKLGIFERVNLFPSIKYNNTKFIIPIIKTMGRSNLYLNRHEPWMLPLIERLVSIKPGAFFDVGVNMGQTLLKLKSVAPQIRYFGFEPNPYGVYYTKIFDYSKMSTLPFLISGCIKWFIFIYLCKI